MQFKEWLILLESRGRPGTKQALYPAAYSGGAYPPADWIPYAADAITYSPPEWLNFKFLYTFDAPPLANRINGVEYVSIPYKMPSK
jgi:hypothetical protein